MVVAALEAAFLLPPAKKSNWSSLSTAPWLSYFGYGLVSSLILEALKAMLPLDHSAAGGGSQWLQMAKTRQKIGSPVVISRFLFQDKFPLDFRFPWVIACAIFKIRQTVGNIKYDLSISRIFHKKNQQIYIISVSGHCMRLLSI